MDKNTTVVFPAPLMSTIGELGSFPARETAAAEARPDRPVATPPAAGPAVPAPATTVMTNGDAGRSQRRRMSRAGVVLAAAAVGVIKIVLRARLARWGATAAEVRRALPGDDLVGHADLTSTRAITVHAPAAAVWPWIAQLGQGRGGFYSYDAVENLLGLDIHSAELIVPEWQSVEVGMTIRLAAQVPLTVSLVEPGQALVLRGSVPMGQAPTPYDFTWAFVLCEGEGGTTRLLVRERYGYLRWWARLIVEPVSSVSFVMTRRMLRGIRERAERT
ncbi:hypothetical protein ACVGOW_13215 [Pseudonocardia saturnea]